MDTGGTVVVVRASSQAVVAIFVLDGIPYFGAAMVWMWFSEGVFVFLGVGRYDATFHRFGIHNVVDK